MRVDQLLPDKKDARRIFGIDVNASMSQNYIKVCVDHEYNRPDIYSVSFPHEVIMVLKERLCSFRKT